MRVHRYLATFASCVLAVSTVGSAGASSARANIVKQQNAAGSYTVAVTVNGVHTTFSATLK